MFTIADSRETRNNLDQPESVARHIAQSLGGEERVQGILERLEFFEEADLSKGSAAVGKGETYLKSEERKGEIASASRVDGGVGLAGALKGVCVSTLA
jgi:hypothetical protein